MTPLHQARFYETLPDGKVLCTLCPHDCHVPDGGRYASPDWGAGMAFRFSLWLLRVPIEWHTGSC